MESLLQLPVLALLKETLGKQCQLHTLTEMQAAHAGVGGSIIYSIRGCWWVLGKKGLGRHPRSGKSSAMKGKNTGAGGSSSLDGSGLLVTLCRLVQQTPGPCNYRLVDPSVYKTRPPHYSMLARNMPPGDNSVKPGPGAYSPEKVRDGHPIQRL